MPCLRHPSSLRKSGDSPLQPEGETEAPRERSLLEVVRAALLVDAGEYQTVKVERPDAGPSTAWGVNSWKKLVSSCRFFRFPSMPW